MFDVKGKGWFWKNKKQNIDNTNSEKEPSEKTIYNLLGRLHKFLKVLQILHESKERDLLYSCLYFQVF